MKVHRGVAVRFAEGARIPEIVTFGGLRDFEREGAGFARRHMSTAKLAFSLVWASEASDIAKQRQAPQGASSKSLVCLPSRIMGKRVAKARSDLAYPEVALTAPLPSNFDFRKEHCGRVHAAHDALRRIFHEAVLRAHTRGYCRRLRHGASCVTFSRTDLFGHAAVRASRQNG
jgi:hypothetical protein